MQRSEDLSRTSKGLAAMSKILYTYEYDMPTVSIFRNNALREKQKNGRQYRFKQIMDITPEDIDWCDVVDMIRPNDPFSACLAKRAREAGCFVTVFYDDDLYALPKSKPNPFWRKNSIMRVLQSANMLGSSSRYICEKYQGFTVEKRGFVSDTVVEESEIKQIEPLNMAQEQDRKVRLIYAANPGHISFFNQFIMPIMPKLCERYAGKISMTFMGVRPELAQYESQIEITYINTMPLNEYRQKIKDGNYDIGLSPLITDEFTKCKYFNKFIEYTMAGIVGMYSDTEPYSYVVENGVNGILVKDDPEAWFESFCVLIEDVSLRNRCVCAAQKLLREKFTAERLREMQSRAVPELCTYSGQRKPCKKFGWYQLLYRVIPVADRIYQVFFYMRKTGISGLIQKIKMHFRERNAFSK